MTSLAADPLTYVHPGTLSRHNLKYGDHEHKKLDFAQHALATPDSPLLVDIHGGAYRTGDKTTLVEADRVMTPLRSWLLDNVNYPETSALACSHASIELPQYSHLNSSPGPYNTPYVVTRTGAHGGEGRYSRQFRMPAIIEAAQEAIQWLKDHANTNKLGKFNPNRIVLRGYSMGALTALCVAYTPSRHYFSRGRGRDEWDRYSTSHVRGVIDCWGEVSTDTRKMSGSVTCAGFGQMPFNQATMDALMLEPDADGALSMTSEQTPLCRATSPLTLIANSSLRMRYQKILAFYDLAENSVDGAPWNAKNAGGHHYLQLTDLKNTCDGLELPHNTGPIFDTRSRVLDILNDFGDDKQLAMESVVAIQQDFIRSTVGLP